jgi:hypothetical protein
MRRKILVKFFLAKVFLFICTIADGHFSVIKTIGTDYPTLQALNAQDVTEHGVTFYISAGYTENFTNTNRHCCDFKFEWRIIQ